jgi:ribosomal protein S18 acetylase RimI-like enzyme
MSNENHIRPAVRADQPALLKLATDTGLFQPEELGPLEEMIDSYFAGDLGEEHFWIVYDHDNIQGAAYYAPEVMADRVWNLYFIGVTPEQQGAGIGSALLKAVEQALRAKKQRLLLIETSGLGHFELTRRFYHQHQYDEESRIRDYYTAGDDKVVFRKLL